MLTIHLMWKVFAHGFWQGCYTDLGWSEMAAAHEVNALYYQNCLQNRLDSKGLLGLFYLPLILVVIIFGSLWHLPQGLIARRRYNRMQKLFKQIGISDS